LKACQQEYLDLLLFLVVCVEFLYIIYSLYHCFGLYRYFLST